MCSKVIESKAADLSSRNKCPGFPVLRVLVRNTLRGESESWVDVPGRTEVLAPLRIRFG
jgi:hypothetical protein